MKAGRVVLVWGIVCGGLMAVAMAQMGATGVTEINTAATEKSPFLSFDGLTLYFSRHDGTVLPYTRIFQAQRVVPNGPFTSIQEIPGLAYANGHVDYPWVSADNLRIYYYRTESGGDGNLDVDPLLRDPNGLGLFLASERGRYWPQYDLWVIDDETSPCIDAGDPKDDASVEPTPHGERINMGAYGGTQWASRSLKEPVCFPLDVEGDGSVDLQDPYTLINAWLAEWEAALTTPTTPS